MHHEGLETGRLQKNTERDLTYATSPVNLSVDNSGNYIYSSRVALGFLILFTYLFIILFVYLVYTSVYIASSFFG